MARSQRIGDTQFKDLSMPWKVATIAGGIGGLAAGWFLPRWITLLLFVLVFVAVFAVQKLRRKA